MRRTVLIARAFGWASHQLDRLLHPSLREGAENEHWLSRLLIIVCLAMQFGLWRAAFSRFVLEMPIDLGAVIVSSAVALVRLRQAQGKRP